MPDLGGAWQERRRDCDAHPSLTRHSALPFAECSHEARRRQSHARRGDCLHARFDQSALNRKLLELRWPGAIELLGDALAAIFTRGQESQPRELPALRGSKDLELI